jgi:hypothetical protein
VSSNVSVAGNIVSGNLTVSGNINVPATQISRFSNQTYTWPSPAFTAVTVIYNSVTADSTSWYNTSNGRFTPTRAGYYQISACARIYSTPSAEASMNITKNGVTIGSTSGLGLINGTISRLVFLNGTTDFVLIQIVNGATSGTAPQSEANSFFTAVWVGS